MLHSLPALLDELERRLMMGEDPMPLLGSIRWADVMDWPRNRQEALDLKNRLKVIQALVLGLQAPLQATLIGLNQNAAYKAKGGMALPTTISLRIQDCV